MNWNEYQGLLDKKAMSAIAAKMGLPVDCNRWSSSNCIRFEQECIKEKARLLLKEGGQT